MTPKEAIFSEGFKDFLCDGQEGYAFDEEGNVRKLTPEEIDKIISEGNAEITEILYKNLEKDMLKLAPEIFKSFNTSAFAEEWSESNGSIQVVDEERMIKYLCYR